MIGGRQSRMAVKQFPIIHEVWRISQCVFASAQQRALCQLPRRRALHLDHRNSCWPTNGFTGYLGRELFRAWSQMEMQSGLTNTIAMQLVHAKAKLAPAVSTNWLLWSGANQHIHKRALDRLREIKSLAFKLCCVLDNVSPNGLSERVRILLSR